MKAFEESDQVIFLLSTSWFGGALLELEDSRLNPQSIAKIERIARGASDSILGIHKSYYNVDLSDKRRTDSFDKFLKTASRELKKEELAAFNGIINGVMQGRKLPRAHVWAVRNLFISEVASHFMGDMDGAIEAQLRDEIEAKLRKYEEIVTSATPGSGWDLVLANKFEGMQSYLPDYADANFFPLAFLDFLANRLAVRQADDHYVMRVCEWISAGLVPTGLLLDVHQLFDELKASRRH